MTRTDDPGAALPTRRTFYGRRHGKTLKPSQRAYLAEDLGRLDVPGVGMAQNPGRVPIDLAALFGDARPVWLEIGFGAGEHMVRQAQANPGVGIIGCEPFVNGVAMALGRIRREGGAEGIRIHPGDARDLLDVLPPASLSRAFLLYPDPWPKRRHRDRRFVTPGPLAQLARALAPGAEFRIASDVPDYIAQALEEVPRHGFACLTPPEARGTAWPGWSSTRYEAKALREGRSPAYLTFVRL
jgi:tRNA (guanine-N7-)-methyltransferase